MQPENDPALHPMMPRPLFFGEGILRFLDELQGNLPAKQFVRGENNYSMDW
jgi:hypothetical protein